MPKKSRPIPKKVDPKITARMLQLSNRQIGEICDRMEIDPITYKHHLRNNTPKLLKGYWQIEIKSALGIDKDQDINVDL